MRGRGWRRWRSGAPAVAGAVALAGCGGGASAGPDGEPGRGARATRADVPSLPATREEMDARGGSGPRAAARVRLRPGETLAARVRRRVALRRAPAASAPVLARAGRRTEFASATVLAVMRRRGRWYGVAHPELGNGRIGWVRADRVGPLREPWSIVVDLSERRATVRHLGRLRRTLPVAVGAPGTPTPTGRFGVTDRLDTGGAGSTYGCCVLALSGRQPDVPQEWPGGDRLAIHGTSAPATIGTAASLGCLRASEASMRYLLRRIPLGAQVVIRR